ncbi:MAG TPA: alanine racemase, partial [Rectinemataceae bacterium]|nr:alanine racemase [Rectinemataceae bacterium]
YGQLVEGAQAGLAPRLDVLLELHTGEESKTGFADTDSLLAACEAASAMNRISVRGLMTMAPLSPDQGIVRSSFRALKEAFALVQTRFGFPGFEVLSMGMSGDFELAVEEGSTLIRVGTALFGSRTP